VQNTDSHFLGHPRGLGLLFGVEMWERFSYYGMRALLVLYLVNGLHWSDRDAANLYGTYTGLVYGVQIVGGFLADRFLGTRRSLVIGGIIIALGHFVLAIPTGAMLYLGLGLVVAGTGLFKPNVSTMVGQLYAPDDTRRDAGFTIFYMGINIGATFAPLVTGYLAQKLGWHWGFGAAGVGMVLGLLIFVWGRNTYLAGIGVNPPGKRTVGDETAERDASATTRILALLLLFAFVGVFWMGYDQAGSSVNLFTDRHVDRRVGSFETPTAWYQSVQPFAVLVFAPLFAVLWAMLSRRSREPSTPTKWRLGSGCSH
jgi:POT family proton-dependent oligopeptide transporter